VDSHPLPVEWQVRAGFVASERVHARSLGHISIPVGLVDSNTSRPLRSSRVKCIIRPAYGLGNYALAMSVGNAF
jgi:hypothetical protein